MYIIYYILYYIYYIILYMYVKCIHTHICTDMHTHHKLMAQEFDGQAHRIKLKQRQIPVFDGHKLK